MQKSGSRLVSVAGLALGLSAANASAQGFVYVGPGEAAPQHARRYSFPGGQPAGSFFAYDPTFTGGVRVAAGDINGDGVPDTVTGTGGAAPAGGGGPHVKVFDGVSGSEIRSFFPHPGFSGGVYVAAGDINNDGVADLISGTDGGGGLIRAFDGLTHASIRSFSPYGSSFTGGITVAAGDVNGDGFDDIISAPTAGGAPNVRVFSGADHSTLHNFFATTPSFSGGVFVASGDVNGDGFADIVTGLDGAGQVSIFSGATLAPLGSFSPYGPSFTGGVRVAVGDLNGDGAGDIITGTGPGGGPHIKVFDGRTLTETAALFPYDPTFTGGVFVAAAAVPEPCTIAAALMPWLLFTRSSARRRRE